MTWRCKMSCQVMKREPIHGRHPQGVSHSIFAECNFFLLRKRTHMRSEAQSKGLSLVEPLPNKRWKAS
ncbi:hypothetical protein CBM2606_A30452 [Cupriavidus taiwanensis]|nr:hypothetical protein CBM2606_A30452 [Cupriavidus taiwanensis]SPA48322.1 protein of unknown function [Cupriavidus taiwanensis]